MTHSVSAALAARLAANNTQPGLLVEIQFSSGTVRYCTLGQREWPEGTTWFGKNLQASGLDGKGAPSLTIFDEDAALRTLMLQDGVAEAVVRIYYADDDTLVGSPSGDPLLLFEGVGGASSWGQGRARIVLLSANALSTLCPRTRMTPATGYNFLAPKGYEFAWGDKIIRLT